jgi:predicted DNA binding CopG/RHH family protein
MKKYVKPDSSTAHADFAQAKPVVFANLKPTSAPISLRLPMPVLERLKREAHRRGVPYQSYIKTVLAEAVAG